MEPLFPLVDGLRYSHPLPRRMHAALGAYQEDVFVWYNDICEHGYGTLSGDDILDLADEIREIIEWPDEERLDIWDPDALTLDTDDGLHYLHPDLREEEIRFIPFLFHLVRPTALDRLMGYSQDLVSLLSMCAIWYYSRGIVTIGQHTYVMPSPGYTGDNPGALTARNGVIETLAHIIAFRLYERAVTEDEMAATIRLFWKDLDDEPNIYLTDLEERTASFNYALGLGDPCSRQSYH